ncbi:hypothetical protein LRS13_12715 [Svornostia abyssi]|uniref:Uncharacterized protein n=1 Tax=Svornostia abyssi TaxID=2898438 RepID=A0ABY5PAW9_9ACTN|nr:hypothetical protein LRS13_12715 [Parviterribacteraceae bacterium J379]
MADRYGMPFGASVQSWYFREQTDLGRQAAEGFPTDSIVDIPGRHTGQPPTTGTCCVLDPLNHNNYQGYSSPPLRHNIRTYEQPSLPPTTANTQRLAQYGRRLGATFFQVEGTNGTYKVAGQPPGNLPENQGPVNDMAHGSDYLSGIRQFSDSDLRQAVSRDDIRTKPLYQLWNPYTTTHYYTTDTTAGIPREPSGTQAAACPSDNSPPPVGRYCYYSYDGKPEVTGFLATTQVAGTVPLRRYRNQASNGFYYVTDGDPRASSSRYGIPNGYVSDGILGYVVPATAGSVQIPGTQPWYWMREGTQSIAGKYDYFYTTDPLYQRLPALGSDYTYKDFGVNAWLFTHGPDDTTPPTITLSGGLYNKRDTYSVDGSYGLQVRSADGNPNGGDQARGSGIRRVDVFVRGARKFTTGDVPCTSPAGSCARTDNWTFNTNASPGGDQEVTVRATDHAGNSAESRFTVYTKRDRLQGDPTGAGDDATVTSSNPHPSLRWGIATETADFFDDPRFKSLEVNTVRRTVEWDVVTEALGAAPPQGTTDSTYYNLDVTAAPPVPLDISVLGQRNHPYNALLEVDRWMDRACPRDIADGRRVCVYQPLISFWFNKALGERGPLPSTAEYARGVAAFLARYPFVTMYTPWNEPNAPYQTSAGDPYAVARFYLNLAQQCDAKGCTVAAGNFFAGDTLTLAKHRWPMMFDGQNWKDNTNTNLNLKTYLQEFRSRVLPTRAPAAWAANDYKSGNHLRPGWLRQFVIGTQDDTSAPMNSPGANIWLVEQGGLYRVTKDVNGQRTEDYWVSDNSANAVVGRGTRAVRYYVGNPDSGHPGVMRLFPRISRFYLYQWRGDNGWDSGLIDYLSNSARTEFFCFRYKTNEQPGDRTRCDPANPINSGETNVFSP